MPKRPIDPQKLLPAVKAVLAREEGKLLEALRGQTLHYGIGKTAWRRLGEGLAASLEGPILGAIRTDFTLMGSIPFVKLTPTETRDLLGALDKASSVKAFEENVASKKKESRNAAGAVRYYIQTILEQGQGMEWLRSRQPQLMGVVDRMSKLHRESTTLCLARVDFDRTYLAQCFLDGNTIKTLSNVVVTDSDAHKGGKRVLFLDLSYRSGSSTQTRRVVYKPSDVEFDYRVAGKNTDAVKKLFTDEHASGRFPEPHESFYELLDRLKLRDRNVQLAAEWTSDAARRSKLEALLALPTYVIVPRNPGSRLEVNPQSQRLPIDTSYGYLEYLPFQPKAPNVGQAMDDAARAVVESYVSHRSRWQWDPRAPKDALDWVLDDRDLARPAFRLWGRLMSVACVLLQTDLHHQNQRLRGFKPHLIDLENGLIKSCPTPGGDAGTMIPESLRRFATRASDNATMEATNNQLYLRVPGKKRTVSCLAVNDPASSLQVKEGIREALAAMSEIREEIANWVQASSLADVVVRHVVAPTGSFLQAVSDLTRELRKPENADRDLQEILKPFMEDRREVAIQQWRQSTSPYMKEDNPEYGVELPEYNGSDFVNRDIPTYYRRAGSLDLLTWWGETVVYKKQAGDAKILAFPHYHKNKGLDLLKASLTGKLPKDAAAVREKSEEFIRSAFDRVPSPRGGGA